ncbi:hypothetical protein OH76DRAFT_697475 [Lentinus brumalis]|uniref:Uncharacterized protein n=1 Tax=Lentinus brumalis TaxID=2498619 RepID=A0A371D6C5_9APHY|nr:hypothetical protein OH76DRAFT_697475 [Polyporus brumalis]
MMATYSPYRQHPTGPSSRGEPSILAIRRMPRQDPYALERGELNRARRAGRWHRTLCARHRRVPLHLRLSSSLWGMRREITVEGRRMYAESVRDDCGVPGVHTALHERRRVVQHVRGDTATAETCSSSRMRCRTRMRMSTMISLYCADTPGDEIWNTATGVCAMVRRERRSMIVSQVLIVKVMILTEVRCPRLAHLRSTSARGPPPLRASLLPRRESRFQMFRFASVRREDHQRV